VITAINDLQMEEYRARVRPTPPPSRQQTMTGFCLDGLASQYNLGDMMVAPDVTASEDTVDKEYKAYIKSVSPKNTDTLKFWEVNIRHPLDTLIELIDNKHFSSMKPNSPLSLPWRSTISRSRPLPFLVSASSRQVQKPIQSDETASIRS